MGNSILLAQYISGVWCQVNQVTLKGTMGTSMYININWKSGLLTKLLFNQVL